MSKIRLSIIFLLLLSCKFSSLMAQAPQKMSYQAVLRNSSAELMVNTVVGMRISIIQGSESGVEMYAEVQKPSTNANGLVSLAIGTGMVLRGSFSAVNWGNGPYFIKTETDPRGGASYSITGISQFMSVPYALFAANSGSASGAAGKSAYEIWKDQPGNSGKTEADFLTAIKGTDGKSAFEVWKTLAGNTNKTMNDFIGAIKGADGISGKDGANGAKGESVYDIWKKVPANAGKAETEFLESINAVKGEAGPKGELGDKGESVYDIWKKVPANAGKTETEFLESIKAVKGDKGEAGPKGEPGVKGELGDKGESIYDIWKKVPANAGKTETEFLESIKAVKGDKGEAGPKGEPGVKGELGDKGESVYDIWKKVPANAGKTEAEFLESIKAVKGDKGEAGLKGEVGEKGESVYDIWKKDPINSGKTEADFLEGIKAVKGDKGEAGLKGEVGEKGESVYDIWKKDPINSGKTEADFLEGIKAVKGDKGESGEKGESVYDIWKKDPINSGKTEADFLEGIKAVKGDKGDQGQSAFDLWKEKAGNSEKSLADYEASLIGQNGKTILNGISDPGQEIGTEGDFFINTQTLTFFGPKANDGTWPVGSILKGKNGIGLDFKGSYSGLATYSAAGNAVELNKAYYNSTDKKSYIYTGTGWEIFAQDGAGGTGGSLDFNVDRNITRVGLPGVGSNLGAGKTTAQFLEDYFFPRLAATPPAASLSGSSFDIPYATWKNFQGFATTLNFNYSVTNKSKQDDTEDKDIASIRLLSGATEIAVVSSINNTVNPIVGTFSNVAFSNPSGSKTVDFSKAFQLEVKDQQPTTVSSNTLTAYMRKAIKLSLTTPTVNPSTLVYEYGTSDIPIILNWTFNKNDETIKDIKVSGVSTGSLTSVTQQVIFKAIANGGTDSQTFPVAITGDIYGITTAVSPTIKWESTLYRGTISSPIAPCEGSFSISDNAIANGNTTLLGGTWKGDAGYDFVCDAGGKYVFYAYPDDGAAPVVEYYDATFKAWQRYPDNQLKVITKTNFENASGYKGKTYKLVFVCVEYKSATVKIRIN